MSIAAFRSSTQRALSYVFSLIFQQICSCILCLTFGTPPWEAMSLNLRPTLSGRAPAMADLALRPLLGKPVMAYYYVTYKCNARCVFCNIPDGPMDVLPVSQYTSTDKTIEHLDILKKLG